MTSEMIVPIVTAVLASSGFWTVINLLIQNSQKKKEKKEAEIQKKKEQEEAEQSVERRALLGLLHDRVYDGAKSAIRDGYISDGNYENLQYLYKPYHEMGGNGTCERLMKEVEGLPIQEEKG